MDTRAIRRMPAFVTNYPIWNALCDGKCRLEFTEPCDLGLCGDFDLGPKVTKWILYHKGYMHEHSQHKLIVWT